MIDVAVTIKDNNRKESVEMKTKMFLLLLVLCVTLGLGFSSSFAQTNPVFVQLGQAKGALYKPDSGPPPHVGIIVMHREANYMNNIACTEFSKRGFMVLCMNSRFENNESVVARSEEHTSELQSLRHLVCRLLLEKKKHITY